MQQTHILGASNNIWQNVYAGSYYGSGANLTNIPFSAITNVSIDYKRSEITNKFIAPKKNKQQSHLQTALDSQRIPEKLYSNQVM